MRVVRADEPDGGARRLDRRGGVVERGPADLVAQERVERCRVERVRVHAVVRRAREVLERVAWRGRPQIVRPVHEHPRRAGEGRERFAHGLESIRMPQVVSRVDHQVGAQPCQARDPLTPAALPRREVCVGDVQHPDGAAPRLEHAHDVRPQRVEVTFDSDAPYRGRSRGRGNGAECGECGAAGPAHRLVVIVVVAVSIAAVAVAVAVVAIVIVIAATAALRAVLDRDGAAG